MQHAEVMQVGTRQGQQVARKGEEGIANHMVMATSLAFLSSLGRTEVNLANSLKVHNHTSFLLQSHRDGSVMLLAASHDVDLRQGKQSVERSKTTMQAELFQCPSTA